jgi:hypothetical protein
MGRTGLAALAIGLSTLGLAGTPGAWAGALEDVVAKHLAARGGIEKLKAVGTVRITGKLEFAGAGMEAPLLFQWKAPNKLRSEFTLQGLTGVQAYDGKQGWAIMPFQGKTDPEPLGPEEIEQIEEQADFHGAFVDSEAKGYRLEYLGTGDVDGKPAHRIKITNRRLDETIAFIDAESFLEIKSEAKRTFHDDQEIEIEITRSDFKEVGGLMLAHTYESKPKGQPAGQRLLFEKIEVGVEIPDSVFAMPVAAPVEAAAPGS